MCDEIYKGAGAMRIVGIAELQSGDVLEKSVLNHSGMIMLEAGTVLTDQYIARLKSLKIKHVHLTSLASHAMGKTVGKKRSLPTDSWLRPDIDAMKNDEKSRRDAIGLVGDFVGRSMMFEQIALPFPEANFRQVFRDILLEITLQPALAEELGVLMLADRQLFEHALNVTLCTSILGNARSFDKSKLYELALGALFSDIGMTRLPIDFTKVNRELTPQELAILRQHTNEGYRVLKGLKEVPMASAQCALLHHERYRGSGYPLGMTNESIPEFAQMVAIADVYSALGSPRHHRNAYEPAEAIEYLFASGNYGADQVFFEPCRDLPDFDEGAAEQRAIGYRNGDGRPSDPASLGSGVSGSGRKGRHHPLYDGAAAARECRDRGKSRQINRATCPKAEREMSLSAFFLGLKMHLDARQTYILRHKRDFPGSSGLAI
jgi:HD-GYP domain-containing protein (c-di-GMP phosphodiesterase class II)